MNYPMGLVSVVPSIHKWVSGVQSHLIQISTEFLKRSRELGLISHHDGYRGLERKVNFLKFHLDMAWDCQDNLSLLFGIVISSLKGAFFAWLMDVFQKAYTICNSTAEYCVGWGPEQPYILRRNL